MAAHVGQSTDLPVNYIGSVLKKYGVNHGIAIIDNGNKSSSEKSYLSLQTLQWKSSDTESIELTCEKKNTHACSLVNTWS
jgi:hypothetical protein